MSFAEKGYRHGAVYYEIEDGRLNGVSEFLDYPLQHPLVSVPAKPLPLTEVLDLLRALPDKDKMSEEEPVPYLEVNVLLDAPVAGINKQVEDVLQSKNVRLCRTVIAYRVQQSAGDGGSGVGIGRRFADARPDRGDQKELSEQVPLRNAR